MSTLRYDGAAHTLTLIGNDGTVLGSWPANNRTASTATIRHVPNGPHPVQDQHTAHRHHGTHNGHPQDSVDGEYGTYGIVRFSVAGHPGIGVHSGRANVPDRSPEHGRGPNHVTQGCIRTTDEAMLAITQAMTTDPLSSIVVSGNGHAGVVTHHPPPRRKRAHRATPPPVVRTILP